MILKLHYSETALHSSSAAFIRGTSSYEWLKEINNWETSLEDLECYILPYSIENISPAGLFVIFKKGIVPKQHYPLDTYGEVAKGIYVPVRSALTPATTGEELKKICLWELQVFHPTIGLTGFETKDQINLVDLINTGFSTGADWSFAHSGIPAKPAFTQINVLQPSVQDIMDDFKKDIDTKSLADIPKDKKQKNGLLYKIWDRIKWIILLFILFIARLLNKVSPKSTNAYNSSSTKK